MKRYNTNPDVNAAFGAGCTQWLFLLFLGIVCFCLGWQIGELIQYIFLN